jgi:chromosome segregation ATPase
MLAEIHSSNTATSLILLSAISSVSNPPFRVIDEFDVYQDEGTRKKSLQYIMEDAARKGEDGMLTQFVLLTPHDVSQLGKDFKLDVKSFTMPGECLCVCVW